MNKLTIAQKVAINTFIRDYDKNLNFYEILESVKTGDARVWEIYEPLRKDGVLTDEIESLAFTIKESFKSMTLDILDEITRKQS